LDGRAPVAAAVLCPADGFFESVADGLGFADFGREASLRPEKLPDPFVECLSLGRDRIDGGMPLDDDIPILSARK
jgi:hypothetical protein